MTDSKPVPVLYPTAPSQLAPRGEGAIQRVCYQPGDISIAIPTFEREEVLLHTIRLCLLQAPSAGEILVIDQTRTHAESTEKALAEWNRIGCIRWIRPAQPSIPAAMNLALLHASRPLVLFLDDDIVPAEELVAAHAAAHGTPEVAVVVGQIIQPWQQPADLVPPRSRDRLRADFDFPFHSTCRAVLKNAMAGHMSVVRETALGVGGFDENFRGTAYRFETEFARRICRAGGKIVFEPAASIRHLRSERGGTRVHGNHLASASPIHGVGDYYFALQQGIDFDSARYIGRRLLRELCTRFHLRHPWYIPVKFVGEVRALCWAWQLRRSGPALIKCPIT